MLDEVSTELTLLAVAAALWCALHSWLIAPAAARALKLRLGPWYRVVYNLVATITLIPLLLFERALSGPILFDWSGAWRYPRFCLLGAAALLFVGGARSYNLRRFAGIEQLTRPGAALESAGELRSGGLLGASRHPWYLGALLLIWAWPLERAGLILRAVFTAYLLIGTLLEERKLVAEFGESYRDYQRRVPMLVPWKWLVTRPPNRK
jgi:protein-S-isoprenylcysteine O-methyltransferase Ste14